MSARIKSVISCEQHDYFEIVCMRQSFVELTLDNGQLKAGYALDLMFDSKHQSEMIKLKQSTETQLIDIKQVKVLAAVNNNPAHNFKVDFS